MPLKTIILGLLAEGDKHPYGIQAEIRARGIDKYLKVQKGSLYYAVAGLAREGLIRERRIGKAEVDPAHPDKRVYRISAEGRAEFLRLLREGLAAAEPEERGWFACLPFSRRLEADERAALLGALAASKRDELEQLRATLDACNGKAPRIGMLMADESRRRVEAELALLDAAIEADSAGELFSFEPVEPDWR
jgi:DNA-binding PadR family transcriptional regulator